MKNLLLIGDSIRIGYDKYIVPALGINEPVEYREEMYTDKPVGI